MEGQGKSFQELTGFLPSLEWSLPRPVALFGSPTPTVRVCTLSPTPHPQETRIPILIPSS